LRRLLLAGCLIPFGFASASADDTKSKPPTWRDSWAGQRYVGVSYLWDSDSLEGFEVGYGGRSVNDYGPCWGAIWLTRVTGEGQEVIGLRGDLTGAMIIEGPWGGIGPLLSVGIEHREQAPDAGLGGTVGAGVAFLLWTPMHWQVNLDIERAFGVSSQTRNQANLAFGYAW
jgi:hypothetical protein